MKPEMRQKLAEMPFEEKIRKVSQLIQLSREVKMPTRETADKIRKIGEHEMKRERSGR